MVLLLYNTLWTSSQVFQNLIKVMNALDVGEAKFGINYACWMKRYTKQISLINRTAFLLYSDLSLACISYYCSLEKSHTKQRGPQVKEISDYNSAVQNCILRLIKI